KPWLTRSAFPLRDEDVILSRPGAEHCDSAPWRATLTALATGHDPVRQGDDGSRRSHPDERCNGLPLPQSNPSRAEVAKRTEGAELQRSPSELCQMGGRRTLRPKWLRRVGPFLKEFVKRKRFSSRWLRNGSAGRSRGFFRFVARAKSCVLLVVSVSG